MEEFRIGDVPAGSRSEASAAHHGMIARLLKASPGMGICETFSDPKELERTYHNMAQLNITRTGKIKVSKRGKTIYVWRVGEL